MRSFKDNISLFLKGMAMGAADVVPGVSGGTIAFITGIYEELLETISKINLGLLKTLRKEGLKSFWRQINGNFLAVLFSGIAVSIISFASLIQFLLREHEVLLWAFFFGLIIASVWLVGKQVRKWNAATLIGLIAGTIIAYLVTLATPTGGSENLLYIFFCGTIAITAMILPGISGSFILLLLGAYTTVLSAVSDLNIVLIGVFAVGCFTGLISFSKVLNWLFKKAHDLTVAILAGFLIGSLNKIWPWKETLETFTKHAGEANEKTIPIVQRNVMHYEFEYINGIDSQFLPAIGLATIGLILIILLDHFSPKS